MKILYVLLIAACIIGQASLPLRVGATKVAFAETQGKIQLSIPSPPTPKAGETVTFQTIILNQGTEMWEKGQYYLETEIYDDEKKYITKLDRIKGKTDINPGETIIAYLDFAIPATYSGKYYYKVFLILKEKRIVESDDYHEFNIIAAVPRMPSISRIKFSGNMTISFRNTSKNNWNNYIGNINLNTVAQTFNKPSLLNLYTYHVPRSTYTTETEHKIFNILCSNYGPNHSLYIGDVSPGFSHLGLYGSGMRGIYLNAMFSRLGLLGRLGLPGNIPVDLIISRITEAKEGTNETSGIYERLLSGGRVSYPILQNLKVGVNFITSSDRQDSIMQPGPELTPAKNSVYGTMINFKFNVPLEFDGEYMLSEYTGDTNSGGTVKDCAYRTELKYDLENFNSKILYQEVRPDFWSFGSPGAQNDRRILKFMTNFVAFKKFDIGIGYNRWNNNLAENKSEVTTTQQIYRTNLVYHFSESGPSSIFLALLHNEAAADIRSAQDNFTQTVSLGFNSRINDLTFATNIQQIGFTDKTDNSDDLLTNTIGVSLNSPLSKHLSASMGVNFTNMENCTKQFSNEIQSFTTSLTYNIIPESLTTQLWTNYSAQSNDTTDITEKLDKYEFNTNLEFSLRIKQPLTWVICIIYNFKVDNITTANSIDEKGFSTRLTWSF